MTGGQRTCGSCTLCCKIVSVVDLQKPAMTWCQHCNIGRGCRIYEQKPASCVSFDCMWLVNEWIPDSLRPDRCKIVFEGLYGTKVVLALLNKGNDEAYRQEPAWSLIEHLINRLGYSVMVVPHGCPPREPIVLVAVGTNPDTVFEAVDWATTQNMRRYAEQEGISLEEAKAQHRALIKTRSDGGKS